MLFRSVENNLTIVPSFLIAIGRNVKKQEITIGAELNAVDVEVEVMADCSAAIDFKDSTVGRQY